MIELIIASQVLVLDVRRVKGSSTLMKFVGEMKEQLKGGILWTWHCRVHVDTTGDQREGHDMSSSVEYQIDLLSWKFDVLLLANDIMVQSHGDDTTVAKQKHLTVLSLRFLWELCTAWATSALCTACMLSDQCSQRPICTYIAEICRPRAIFFLLKVCVCLCSMLHSDLRKEALVLVNTCVTVVQRTSFQIIKITTNRKRFSISLRCNSMHLFYHFTEI